MASPRGGYFRYRARGSARSPRDTPRGFASSTLMTFLLSVRLAPLPSTLLCAAIMLVLTLIAWPRLLSGVQGEKGKLLVVPCGVVLLIAALAAAAFFAEGAVLEWSALLITGAGLVSEAMEGLDTCYLPSP